MVPKTTLHTLKDILDRGTSGDGLSKDELVTLLSLDCETDVVEPVFEAAREAARRFSSNRGRIWASIGVDYQPCPLNCRFCSFGQKWEIVTSASAWPDEKVVERSVQFAQQGAHWITLRTTQDYGVSRLCELGLSVRRELPSKVKLAANTGEFDDAGAQQLFEAGFNTVYHAFRLREGIDTGINPAERLHTLEVIARSPLELTYLVEPVGPEHSTEELADEILRALSFKATGAGAMARVPVPGTPLANRGRVADRALALLIAASRLAGGPSVTDICVHPPSPEALRAGANILVVETGAIPRDRKEEKSAWQQFTIHAALEMLYMEGYDV
ncbi:MAG: radical SAM protein [Bacillota bacterium]